jgi:2-polyprenyl-3-methyl-5-hydroxy-6-metoxy-1,4-benzoquinol methylase/uncharacterized protein YbaR (Trm112 family)
MLEKFIDLTRCPVTKSPLKLQKISCRMKVFDQGENEIVWKGILFSESGGWFYPIIEGIPRLLVEAFLDYSDFLNQHLPEYSKMRNSLLTGNDELIRYVVEKNKRTKKSFALEWGLFNYDHDRTWDAGRKEMMDRFLEETAEKPETLKGKLVFDAGCGNGLLDELLAEVGVIVVAMDLSESVVRAFASNKNMNAIFIQGDIQHPPVASETFDLVHSSGVLIHTNNTELSFSRIEPCVRKGGKLSVWLYHPRKNFSHWISNILRKFTSRWPIRFQYYFYLFVFLPPNYLLKRLKGNKQNAREMMIDIMDWFSPEYRWEHKPDEAASWFLKRNYKDVRLTTKNTFGFNMIGIKNGEAR